MTEPGKPVAAEADRPAGVLADEALALMPSDREAAIALARRAVRRAEERGDPDGRCHALLVAAYIGLRRTDYSAALPYVHEALALGDGHEHPHLRHLAQHVRAVWLRREGDGPAAVAMLAELHTHADERPPLHAYFTASALGIAQSMAGEHEAAMRSLHEALKLATSCGSLAVELNALNNAGTNHADLHNFEDAKPMFERCLDGALRLGSRRQTIFAAGNLTQCYGALGMTAEALAVVREHLIPLVRPDDDPSLIRDAEIAGALLDNGLWDEARIYLARTPQHNPQSHDLTDYRTWLEARLMLADGQPRRALEHCRAQQARPRATADTPVPGGVLRLAELAASAAAACGDHAEAYRQMCLAHSTQFDLLRYAARARFAGLQVQHEMQRAVRERDDALWMSRQLSALNEDLQAQVAANQRLSTRLKALALHDSLTGLHNRHHLFQAGPALVLHAMREGLGVSAVMIDLDHFKQINDRYGHEGGDRVLKAFADQARTIVRADDLCCRYGGEEFVMLLARCDQLTAARRVRELLTRFSALTVQAPDGAYITCSFSAGISSPVDENESLDSLLKSADLALYEAKARGRGRVELAAGSRSASHDRADWTAQGPIL